MTPAIETHGLTRYFGDACAVAGIDLRVERGTFYGFLGPNGAGKSTTIKMLTGLLAPSRGEVRVLDHNMLNPREALEAKSRVGVVPEDLALFDNLTAREYLTFIGRMYLLPRETNIRRVFIDSSTTPVTFWTGSNHGAEIVKLEPRRPRYRQVLADGERMRQAFLQRLDKREKEE